VRTIPDSRAVNLRCAGASARATARRPAWLLALLAAGSRMRAARPRDRPARAGRDDRGLRGQPSLRDRRRARGELSRGAPGDERPSRRQRRRPRRSERRGTAVACPASSIRSARRSSSSVTAGTIFCGATPRTGSRRTSHAWRTSRRRAGSPSSSSASRSRPSSCAPRPSTRRRAREEPSARGPDPGRDRGRALAQVRSHPSQPRGATGGWRRTCWRFSRSRRALKVRALGEDRARLSAYFRISITIPIPMNRSAAPFWMYPAGT
jgi:hypothetical protein